MNSETNNQACARQEDPVTSKAHQWIASETGQRTLSEVLREGKQATSLLERDCQVKRESLHEPVTV